MANKEFPIYQLEEKQKMSLECDHVISIWSEQSSNTVFRLDNDKVFVAYDGEEFIPEYCVLCGEKLTEDK